MGFNWLCDEYLGLGPSAYSYLNGKRFSFDRNYQKYITSPTVKSDGLGGDFTEYCMLRLRLKDGIDLSELSARFGESKASEIKQKATKLLNTGLINLTQNTLSLTVQGFLVSNAVIGELLF